MASIGGYAKSNIEIMEFDNNKPIYLQIVDGISEKILSGDLNAEDRLLSVREYGAQIGVNPNTVVRAYEKLTNDGIIYMKRGLGYYVSAAAKDVILEKERKEFIKNELPKLIKRMNLLNIDPKEVLK